ncbi:hypothetical protein T484DRAFT_1897276 [Baffinella frigidus]|nr:hypothetical protein T484DRAFT_1897276 [Cryptophyta sp. CCMP2293]
MYGEFTGNRGAECSVVAGASITGVKIVLLPESLPDTPASMARLHRLVARTLAVRAQSQHVESIHGGGSFCHV